MACITFSAAPPETPPGEVTISHLPQSSFNSSDLSEEGVGGGSPQRGNATVLQASLVIGKMCIGSGVLALPYAVAQGGLLLNTIGLGIITQWNVYSVDCLLRCSELLKSRQQWSCDRLDIEKNVHNGGMESTTESMEGTEATEATEHEIEGLVKMYQMETYGSADEATTECGKEKRTNYHICLEDDSSPPPPAGTTMWGGVAWYAMGPRGLQLLDFVLVMLFIGVTIAWDGLILSFIRKTPFSTGSDVQDLLMPAGVIAILSCVPDIGFLSHFSAIGLLALVIAFVVIAFVGAFENGLTGFLDITQINLWPSSWEAASSWFGVAVFGFGAIPITYNVQSSMAQPHLMALANKLALWTIFATYIAIGDGIRVLFSPTHEFEGDMLQVLPDSWVPTLVRLLLTFEVTMSAPLMVVPCGELLEGKLGLDKMSPRSYRIMVRLSICLMCTIIALYVPGFVYIIGFIGCFCVSLSSFVLPPLFCIQLTKKIRVDGGRSRSETRDLVGGKNGRRDDFNLQFDYFMLFMSTLVTTVTTVLTSMDIVKRMNEN